jgi:hypothetical protein
LVWLARSSVGFSFLITFAAIILFALTFVLANNPFFLAAVLFIVAIISPIVTPFFAPVVCHNKVCVVDRF